MKSRKSHKPQTENSPQKHTTMPPKSKKTKAPKAPKTPKPPKLNWAKSTARRILWEDLKSGQIPMDMPPMEVFLYRPEFVDFDPNYERFRSRLRYLKDSCNASDDRAAEDDAALAHDRNLFPMPTHNHRGEPRWPDSIAEKWLAKDMDVGKHDQLKPSDLHQSQIEYQAYPLAIFRQHIYQEVKKRKFISYLKNKTKIAEAKEAEKKRG